MQAASAIDLVHGLEDPVVRKQAERVLDYLIPIVKAWNTDNGVLLTNLAMGRFTAAWAMWKKPACRNMCAMRASPRFTKAPTAYRRSI